jgi:hypothetical protein
VARIESTERGVALLHTATVIGASVLAVASMAACARAGVGTAMMTSGVAWLKTLRGIALA